jgi:hypothetical protein
VCVHVPSTQANGAPQAAAAYQSYEMLGSTGCTVGGELFSGFGALNFSGTMGETFPGTDLMVSPAVAGGVDELVFTYQDLPAGNYSSTVAGVDANQILGYSFLYTVTPAPTPVTDFQMKSDIGNTGAASVSAVKETDTGGVISESSANNGASDFTLPALVSGPVTPISGTSAFEVEDAVSLQGQNGTAQQQDFTNLFTQGSAPDAPGPSQTPGPSPSDAPEPSTTLLIASGLLCLGLVRKHPVRA